MSQCIFKVSHKDASIDGTHFHTHSNATHLQEHFIGKRKSVLNTSLARWIKVFCGWVFSCTFVEEMFKSFKSIRMRNAGTVVPATAGHYWFRANVADRGRWPFIAEMGSDTNIQNNLMPPRRRRQQ